MDSRLQLIAWLRDAHALEQNLENNLRIQISETKRFPEFRDKLEQHLRETTRHKERVRDALTSLNEAPSNIKSMAAGFMGMMEAMGLAVFRDELLKAIMVNYAMEHFEIACYRSLRVAAHELELTAIETMCEEILKDETAMAEWLEEQIPDTTRGHLQSLAAR